MARISVLGLIVIAAIIIIVAVAYNNSLSNKTIIANNSGITIQESQNHTNVDKRPGTISDEKLMTYAILFVFIGALLLVYMRSRRR